MEPVVLFLAAFVSLVLIFAQAKMFSVDATLREILTELKRVRQAIDEHPQVAVPIAKESGGEGESPLRTVTEDPSARDGAAHQSVLAPWQRDLR